MVQPSVLPYVLLGDMHRAVSQHDYLTARHNQPTNQPSLPPVHHFQEIPFVHDFTSSNNKKKQTTTTTTKKQKNKQKTKQNKKPHNNSNKNNNNKPSFS